MNNIVIPKNLEESYLFINNLDNTSKNEWLKKMKMMQYHQHILD